MNNKAPTTLTTNTSLLEEGEQTGETHLKIPIKDKESVMQVSNLFGKLLTGS